MLAVLIAANLFAATPQGPMADGLSVADAVAIRGKAELSAAEAYASASQAAEQHLRERWETRAARTAELRRPFWVPEILVVSPARAETNFPTRAMGGPCKCRSVPTLGQSHSHLTPRNNLPGPRNLGRKSSTQ